MLKTNYSIRWESYTSNLSNGFIKLQQMQEFIDVTLAAGEHLVGAHQNVLALASPYIKEMLKSAPCQHPVIFLGPINHTVLSFILEYIYTGEVKIPGSELSSFIQAAKMLQIIGIKDLKVPQIDNKSSSNLPKEFIIQNHCDTRPVNINKPDVYDTTRDNVQSFVTGESNTPQNLLYSSSSVPIEASVDLAFQNERVMNVPVNEENVVILQPMAIDQMPSLNSEFGTQSVATSSNLMECAVANNFPAAIKINSEIGEISLQPYVNVFEENDDDEYNINQDESVKTFNTKTDFETFLTGTHLQLGPDNTEPAVKIQENTFKVGMDTEPGTLTIGQLSKRKISQQMTDYDKILGNINNALYVKSTRGSIQMILNRYIYYMHFSLKNNRKRRWRCIEYRKNHCTAYVDTYDDYISKRVNAHSHDYHDAKIIKLGRKEELYTSIARALKRKGTDEEEEKQELYK